MTEKAKHRTTRWKLYKAYILKNWRSLVKSWLKDNFAVVSIWALLLIALLVSPKLGPYVAFKNGQAVSAVLSRIVGALVSIEAEGTLMNSITFGMEGRDLVD